MMQQVDAQDKQAFVERLLRAARTIPLAQEEKNTRIARIVHELVAGAKTTEEKMATLCTVFSKADPAYLAGISDVLAAGLDAGRNGLSQGDFLDVATNVTACVMARTEADGDALIRVAMATATFLRAAGGDQKLADSILGSLGDSDLAGVVRNVAQAAAKGDYGPMLEANAVDRSDMADWFVGGIHLPVEPLMHSTGVQYVWNLATGALLPGTGGTAFGGRDALPSAALPYAGQKIICPCPPTNDDNPPHMVIK
ncbi:MAG: hypothetical protein GX595_18530 [Lentisphaerae bacterium]|nr:hypothetical protein [Lentisphaerota bacterium]